MSNHEHFRKLERAYASAPINRYFAPSLRIERGSAELSIEIRDEFFHAAGAVHGVVYFKALDDTAFFAANSLVEDVFVLTMSFNVYLLRPVTTGTVTATGRIVYRSKRLLVAESRLVDAGGKEIARGSGSFMPSGIRLTPEIGYE